jgi:hypothetical protein
MTPQERQFVDELFDRLAALEGARRDPDAERAITEGLARAPHALYPLVQTVLVQDEALKRADARIRELEGGEAPAESGGFLDTMREALTGRRGSVPSVRSGTADSRWGNAAAAPQAPMAAPGSSGGGSFLGTAAAAAAGMIGGSLLLSSIGSMFGHQGQAFAAYNPSGNADSPWGGSAADSGLAREAGVNDIGYGPLGDRGDQRAGLFDSNDPDATVDDSFDVGGDGGGDFGGSDTA